MKCPMDRPATFAFALLLLTLPTSPLQAQTVPEQPAAAQAAPAESPQVIPTRYEGGLLYAVPVTVTRNDTLLFPIDSGGGNLLKESVARRHELPAVQIGSTSRAPLPLFREGASIPPPLIEEGRMPLTNLQEQLPEEAIRYGALNRLAGLLGRQWFVGRTWTFDYGNGRVLAHAPMAPLPERGNRVAIRFGTDEQGRRTGQVPLLEVIVAGETHLMKFDTGATARLTQSAQETLGLDPASPVHGTSFLRASVFERWSQEHPGWQVIEGAINDPSGARDVIVVPRVEIAGHEIGSVWFEKVKDEAADNKLARTNAKAPIVGWVGGSTLRHFSRITVSYPRAEAVFEK